MCFKLSNWKLATSLYILDDFQNLVSIIQNMAKYFHVTEVGPKIICYSLFIKLWIYGKICIDVTGLKTNK